MHASPPTVIRPPSPPQPKPKHPVHRWLLIALGVFVGFALIGGLIITALGGNKTARRGLALTRSCSRAGTTRSCSSTPEVHQLSQQHRLRTPSSPGFRLGNGQHRDVHRSS